MNIWKVRYLAEYRF